MSSNAVKYASPKSYYELTRHRALSSLLKEALSLAGSGKGKTALDLGCGAGAETSYLLDQGYEVTAVEGNPVAEQFVRSLPHQDKLHFVLSDMETFPFGQYNFINASRSLPFVHKDRFNEVFAKLKASLLPKGIFVGHFFGIHDGWNEPHDTRTFLTKAEILNLLSDLIVVKLNEIEKDDRLINGDPKHWHIFEVIAQKQ